MTHFEHPLRRARHAAGLTQEDLAEHLGVDASTVRRWESGASTPYKYHIEKLCRLFQLPAEKLGFLPSELQPPEEKKELDISVLDIPKSKKEHPSTYIVEDRSNREELTRLMIQDQLTTAQMGGVLAEQTNPSAFHHILDIACGTGGWLVEVAKTYPQISSLVGIDISSHMIDAARHNAMEQGVESRVQFQTMDVLRHLTFPEASFDLINQRFAMSFLRTWDWPRLLQEFLRVLVPGESFA